MDAQTRTRHAKLVRTSVSNEEMIVKKFCISNSRFEIK